ncbi:Hypothetical predicted protein, partial [Paramuricea clavata]
YHEFSSRSCCYEEDLYSKRQTESSIENTIRTEDHAAKAKIIRLTCVCKMVC